jgi:phosphatidate phosphatase APP1
MKPLISRFTTVLLAFTLILTLSQITHSQTITATLTGTVADSNNAVVANAKVTATNQATKNSFTAQTNSSGNYTIPFLPVGEYIVSVEANGFKKVVSTAIKLEVNQTARVNLELAIGAIS